MVGIGSQEFPRRPSALPLLGDGGIATALQALGLPLDGLPEAWNLTHPERVMSVHRAFAAAGAGWCTTNTFGANRSRLADFALAGSVTEICREGVRCAREGAPGVPVLGSIGPVPLETGTPADYVEVAEALAGAGGEALLVETIVSREAGLMAVSAAVSTGLPVIASITPGDDGNLLDGTCLEDAAVIFFKRGAWAVGLNCGSGPGGMREPLRRLAALQEGPVLAAPNAGLPRVVEGRAVYDLPPARFAEAAIEFEELGARLIAGCCGVTAEHIRAAALALRALDREE